MVLTAERLLGRPWAVVSLSLVFELPDGRRTQPAYVSGSGAVQAFLRLFGAAAPGDLVGTAMTIEVEGPREDRPAVGQIGYRQTTVPDSIRLAFPRDQQGEREAALD